MTVSRSFVLYTMQCRRISESRSVTIGMLPNPSHPIATPRGPPSRIRNRAVVEYPEPAADSITCTFKSGVAAFRPIRERMLSVRNLGAI